MNGSSDLSKVWPAFRTWAPPPALTVSQWADRYGIIPEGVSGQAGNTKFRTRPPQRAILDAFGHPAIRTIDVQKSARVGWTLILQLVCGYWCHHDPRSILATQPTEEDAREWSKDALDPFIEDVPEIAERFQASRTRATSTILHKFFDGGSIRLRGMHTGRGLRRFTVGGVLLDEVDAYPTAVGDDGDPVALAAVRAETVWNSVIARGSTPLLEGFSRIERFIARASTGQYLVPCPHCGVGHVRRFRQPEEPIVLAGGVVPVAHLVWPDGKPGAAAYVCPSCGHKITQAHHHGMMARGRWLADDWTWTHDNGFEFDSSFRGNIGFKIWAGYNATPASTPAALATDWLDAKDDDDERQVFVNTRLGEAYRAKGEQPSPHGLMSRCEMWPEDLDCPVIPDALTAMVDLQIDRYEIEFVAWMLGTRESWSVDYIVLPATPDSSVDSESWTDLHKVLNSPYTTPEGPRLVDAVGIDCGNWQERVMAYVRKQSGGRVLPLKGYAGDRPIVESLADRLRRLKKLALNSDKARPVIVGTDTAKLAVYRSLQVTTSGPGYCHFPEGRDREFFDGLTAERMIIRYRKGFAEREWHKVRQRNEPLDCRVGNLVMCALMEQDVIKRRPSPKAPKPARRARREHGGFAPAGWGLGT